jgi:hypothetical protein
LRRCLRNEDFSHPFLHKIDRLTLSYIYSQQMMYPQQLSHGNVLTFAPPGFNQTLHVKFPDCRLAVCEKCKKNYKTRDMCRVRNSHTTEPWTTAFICFTLDDNCTDEDGKYIDKPFAVRMIQWQPYCIKTPFDPKTPVCSACKKTNRTRSFCRDRHKHRQLPWCTVYVLLSPADSIDPATRVAPESTPLDGTEDSTDCDGNAGEDIKVEPLQAAEASIAEGDGIGKPEDKEERKPIKVADDGEDINDISESRTFLAKVSCHANSIHWLELAEFDPADQHAAMQGLVAPDGGHMGPGRGPPMMPGQPIDPGYNHFAHAAMGFAAQQHQMSLKNHQQYFFQMQQRQHQQYAAHQAQWQVQYKQQSDQSAPSTVAPAITAGEAAAQQSKHQQGQPGQGAPPYGQWPAQQNQMAYHQQMYQHQMAQFQQAGGVIPPGAQGEGAPPVHALPPDYHHHPGHHQQGDELEPASVNAAPEDAEENDNKRARHV